MVGRAKDIVAAELLHQAMTDPKPKAPTPREVLQALVTAASDAALFMARLYDNEVTTVQEGWEQQQALHAAASAARPALAALSGKVWLDVETVRELAWAGRAHRGCISCGPDDPTELDAALATAESELRAVEGR